MIALLLLVPLGTAAPRANTYAPGMPHGVRAGPEGTWEVSRGARSATLRYRPDGQLVGLGLAWEAALPAEGQRAVAEGGGNVATLGPDSLVVTGATPCTLPLPTPNQAQVTAASQAVFPILPAEGPFGLAVDATRAVLVEHVGVLLVDLQRCAPVATAGLESWKAAAPVAIIGDELVAAEGTDTLTFRRLRLPDLARLPDVLVQPRDLLAAPGAPGLLMSTGLVSTAGWRPFDSALPVAASGELAYALDLDGRITRWDAAGRRVDQSAPGAVTSLHLVPGPAGTISVGEDNLVVQLKDPSAGAWAPMAVGDGLVARRGDQVAGVPIPGRGVQAGVSPDGRVMVTVADREIVAWRLRDGARLWSVAGSGAAVKVGDTWVAVRAKAGAGSWRFYDPADGAQLGDLDSFGVLTAGTTEVAYAPGLLHGHAWSEAALGAPPARSPAPVLPTLAGPPPTKADDCLDPAAALAPVSAYPRVFNARRAELLRCPMPRVSTNAPAPVAVATEGASWMWTAPEPVTALWDGGDGRVVWTAVGWVGALGPDGALLWARQTAARAGLQGGVVVLRDRHRFTGLDVRSGASLWSRGLESLNGDVAKVALSHAGGDRVRLDLHTGVARREPQAKPGTAYGYLCTAGTCVTDLHRGWNVDAEVGGVAAREEEGSVVLSRDDAELARLPGMMFVRSATDGFLVSRASDTNSQLFVSLDGTTVRELGTAGIAAASPSRAWLADGRTIVAQGAAPPAATARPTVTFAEAAAPRSALPPEQPVPPLPAVAPRAARSAELRLVDGLDGAVLLRGKTPAWTADGRWALGLAGDVAVVVDPLGDVEGRAIADGRVLWHAPLPGATVRSGALTAPVAATSTAPTEGVVGGVIGGAVGASRKTDSALYDETTGQPVGTWSHVSGCLFPAGRRLCTVSTSGGYVLVDEKGAVLGPLPSNETGEAVTFGELVLVRNRDGISALRGGRVVWTVDHAPGGELRAVEGKLVVVSDTEARFADPATGQLIDVVPLPR